MRRLIGQFVLLTWGWLAAMLSASPGARAQSSQPQQAPSASAADTPPAEDPLPAMFPHPETDQLWISRAG